MNHFSRLFFLPHDDPFYHSRATYPLPGGIRVSVVQNKRGDTVYDVGLCQANCFLSARDYDFGPDFPEDRDTFDGMNPDQVNAIIDRAISIFQRQKTNP